MFGLFKSKEDKEIDDLVAILRKTKAEMFLDGNIVIDLSGKILKRYKLTMSIIEEIRESGVLTLNIKDAGYVVLAIGKREAVHVHYNRDRRATKVGLGSSSESMLNVIMEELEQSTKEDRKGNGIFFRDLGLSNLAGALTVLGLEVGMPDPEYETIRLPFYYKGNKSYIADLDDQSWIIF